jgi:hypothetical protein
VAATVAAAAAFAASRAGRMAATVRACAARAEGAAAGGCWVGERGRNEGESAKQKLRRGEPEK